MSVQDGAGVFHQAAAQTETNRKLGLALLVIATAQLMLVLDDTIVGVALPSMLRGLHMQMPTLNWVISGYALTFGGFLLVGGRTGDLLGRRRVFRVGLVLFALASVAGGLAPNENVLIITRLVQGLGAAIASPTALSLLATTFPPGPARNKAFGVYGAMGGLGSVVGLLLGGVLTQYLDWRWVLFINLPIAVAVLLGTTVLADGERFRVPIDIPGAITGTLAVGALIYGLNNGSAHGWTDPGTAGPLAAAVVLGVVFVLVESRSATPMLPRHVLGDRNRLGADLVMFLVGSAMLAVFYFLTLYMQVVKGFSAMHTGLAYLPIAVGIGIAAGGIGPQLLARLTPRAVISIGMIVAAGALSWLGTMSPASSYYAVLLPAMLIGGIGMGLAFVTVTIVGVQGLEPQDMGIGSGLINASQQIGGSIGLAALATVAVAVAKEHSSPTGAAALTDGYTTGFFICAAIFVAALIVAVLTINARPGVPAQPE